jgi:hypothetical protein
MFKIEDVYVEDKKLADVLRALAGLVRGAPRPVPVLNAEPANSKIKANSGGNLIEVFADWMHKTNIQEFGSKDVQDWLVRHGRSKLSANYICKNLKKAGLVKHTGKGHASRYTVKAQS